MIINPFLIVMLSIKSGGISPSRAGLFMLYFLKIFLSFPLCLIEKLLLSKKITNTKIQSPLFIIGYYRSGTTLLHKLLLSNKSFGYLTYTHVIFPYLSIIGNQGLVLMLKKLLKKLRIVNPAFHNTYFKPDDPSEENLYMLCAGMKYSIAWGYLFMKKAEYFLNKYIFFKDAEIKREWQNAYLYTLKKISLKCKGKQLILKNPPNTARIKTLLELFPDAKFIFIYRNPYDLFYSMQYLWHVTAERHFALQKISQAKHELIFLKHYSEVMHQYIIEKNLIPSGNLAEIRFEELKEDPFNQVQNIYTKLNLRGFEESEEDLNRRISVESLYQQFSYTYNHGNLKKIENHWGYFIRYWNYKPPFNES